MTGGQSAPLDGGMKRCSKCGEEKPATREFFSGRRRSPDGLMVWCKVCMKAYAARHHQFGPERLKPPKIEGMKHCPQCKAHKPATAEFFHRAKANPDGLISWCKVCLLSKRHKPDGRIAQAVPEKEGCQYCRKCGEYKPATSEFFNTDRHGLSGLQARCRECQINAHRQRRGGMKRPPMPKIDGMKFCRGCGEYKLANPRVFTVLSKTGDGLGRCRECAKKSNEAWELRNPDTCRAIRNRRRGRLRMAEGDHTPEDLTRQFKAQNGLCYYCDTPLKWAGKGKHHIDHFIPLAKGGSNWPENLVCACPFCNLSKGDKLAHEFMPDRFPPPDQQAAD